MDWCEKTAFVEYPHETKKSRSSSDNDKSRNPTTQQCIMCASTISPISSGRCFPIRSRVVEARPSDYVATVAVVLDGEKHIRSRRINIDIISRIFLDNPGI